MIGQKILGALLVATVALMIGGIDIYLPALPCLVGYFDSTPEFLQLTLIISPIVSACVGFIWGRKADLYCHKTLMLIAVSLFGLGALLCSYMTNQYLFLLSRIIQAIGGSGLSILTVVLLYDLFESEKERARYMALYGAMFPAVFALAPILGAQIFCYFGWQYCFKLVFLVSVVFFVLYAKFLPKKEIDLKKEEDKESALLKIRNLLRDRLFIFYIFGHTLPVCISMLFTANSTFIFQNYFSFTPIGYSFAQCFPIVLNFIGALYYRHLLKKVSMDKTIHIGGLSVFLFSIALAILIFSPLDVSPISLIAVMSVFTYFMSFSISSCMTKSVENRKDDRGIAVAMVSTARNFFGGGFVLVCGYFYNNTPYPMLMMMLALSVILTILLLYFIPKYRD
jgi:DHA1 family bicyclomycin/chloramphenicol resistance-like MFS transporter